MIMDAISWYVASISAFWVSLAGSGLFKLLLLCCLISLICRGRMRWRCYHRSCRCRHCGCRCGHCPCGDGDDEDDEEAEAEAD